MLRLRETSSHPSMKGATINLLLILNSASTMLKRAPPEIVWVMLSPSGRGIPLRAGSPRCCNERPPRSGSPHPPRRGGSPIRPCLLHPLHLEEQRAPEARTFGPRWGGRCTHQRGSPARSRLPRPDGLVRASRLRPRLEGLGAKDRRRGR